MEKIREVSMNKDYLEDLIQAQILERYHFKEGGFKNRLTTDNVILEAVKILNDKSRYTEILSGA